MALPALQEREATLDDLYQHTNKAELLHGRVVPLMPTRRAPSYAAFEIAVSLRQHIRSAGLPGVAVTDNAGFVVNLLGAEAIVRKYTQTSGATTPNVTFTRGQNADVQPTVPGWLMPVGDLFEQ